MATEQFPTAGAPALIILFDGVCNLCNRSVQFVLKHDKDGKFRFASLQSAVGQRFLRERGLPTDGHFRSFVLIEGETVYTRSTASLRVLKNLGGVWSICYGLWIVPAFIRNAVYDWISHNRYRWFGRQETCWLPRPEWASRFLDQ